MMAAFFAAVSKAHGNAAFYAGHYTDAVRHFTDAINLTPTDHLLYSNRSAAYASLNNYSQARTDAEITVGLKPDWAKGYSRLGFAHFALQNFNDAVEAYKKGLEVDPNNEALKSALSDAQSVEARRTRKGLRTVSVSVDGLLSVTCRCPYHLRRTGNLEPPPLPQGQRAYESEANPFQVGGCISKWNVQEDSATAIARVDMPGIGINDITIRFEKEGGKRFMVIEGAEPEGTPTRRSYCVHLVVPDVAGTTPSRLVPAGISDGILTVLIPKIV